MHQQQIVTDKPVETDPLFDTSPAAMAQRFGARVRVMLRQGSGNVREVARMAASYAFLADTSLRLIDREAWTVEINGQPYLTILGALHVESGLGATVIH